MVPCYNTTWASQCDQSRQSLFENLTQNSDKVRLEFKFFMINLICSINCLLLGWLGLGFGI